MENSLAKHPTVKVTALVVEDDASVREFVCELLADEGLDAVALETADEGLDYLERHARHIDLAVVDVRTPGRLDGVELARIATRRWPGLPIVLTSGYTAEEGNLPQQVTFISKPWTIGAFMDIVQQALASRARLAP